MQQINTSLRPFLTRSRRGFTLVELLLVIFIISLVYYFGFSQIEYTKPKPQALTPLNLKSVLTASNSGNMTLICTDECKKCYLKKELYSKFEPYENGIDLTGTKAYTINRSNDLEELEYGRYDDEKICLAIDFYANGSSTPIILEQKEKAYFLPSYFGEPLEVDSVEKAQDIWLENSKLVSNSGDFY
ncbi:MAG: prepilin-type N-terminal cleavage/methylation domain-containing protein [Campylobacterales bacterium]|nr:prepilin-type N-terminal cleavage/methylation domain-containing protein [Campylobacterales bacterium]